MHEGEVRYGTSTTVRTMKVSLLLHAINEVLHQRPLARTSRALTTVPATCVVPLLGNEAEPTKVIRGAVDGTITCATMSMERNFIKCWKSQTY